MSEIHQSPKLQFAYSEAQKIVRERDPDRYFATLFAPEDRRCHLYAVYAFNVEIARIRDVISQPLPGEVRLQWWRDMIETSTKTISTETPTSSHPIAAALLATIAANKLPVQAFLNMLEARIFDLYDDMMPDWSDVEGYCGETCSAIFRLATLILSRGEENGTGEICGHAGVAYGLAGLLRSLPLHSRRGQIYLPIEAFEARQLKREDMLTCKATPELRSVFSHTRTKIWDHLAQTHAAGRFVDKQFHCVFLPLASLKPYLKRMTKKNYQPFESQVDIQNWQRIYEMWRFKL